MLFAQESVFRFQGQAKDGHHRLVESVIPKIVKGSDAISIVNDVTTEPLSLDSKPHSLLSNNLDLAAFFAVH